MRCFPRFTVLLSVAALAACVPALVAQMPTYKLGKTPTAEESRTCCMPVTPDGTGLPPGSGTAKQGALVYAQQCASCHGATGVEGPWLPLVGGTEGRGIDPGQTVVGLLYATTIWDYINRDMPPVRGRTNWQGGGMLSGKPDDVYAVTAFMLYRNGIIGENDTMDAKSLPRVRMPRQGKIVPGRPEWRYP
jgi:hypothetical protein